MDPEVAATIEELQAEIKRNQEENKEKWKYNWFKDATDINFWEYKYKNKEIITWFEVYEDDTTWDHLADKLGLIYQEIKTCWKHNGGYPTRAVLGRLEEKTEKKDMTLREVLEALEKLGQHDVLDCVPWEEGMKLFKKGTPKIEVLTQGSADEGETTSPRVSPSPSENPSRIKLDAKILMVFASDARTEAMRVVHQLRNPLISRGKVGVLLLTDPDNYIVARQLSIEGCNSIHKWFKQVNFVVPVLSPKFLLQIQNRDDDNNTNKEEKLYNRFVYRLLLDHYVSRGSKNLKCRPLYPVEFSRQVLQSELVKDNGLLMMLWKCSSEESVEEFAKIITNEVRQRRK